jgi:required for meiotic nuclear division protein 1
MRGSAFLDQLSAGDFSLDTATSRLTMNSADGVAQRGVVELGRPTASKVPAGTVEVVPVRALLLGERLDTRALERDKPLGIAPLTVEIAGGGIAVLFRYGAIVIFGMATATMDTFVASLKPLIAGVFPVPEQDEVRLLVRPDIDQQVDPSGNIILNEKTTEPLQLVADILAKSLVLSHYEKRIAHIFDRIEPLAATLRERGRAGASSTELLRYIGEVLLMQQKMVGRVETSEKPELLWEHPELERLYMRLADEYELRDRDRALDRKLDVVCRTVETLLGLEQTRSSLRVEWYIVLLIIAELLLTTYPLLLHR